MSYTFLTLKTVRSYCCCYSTKFFAPKHYRLQRILANKLHEYNKHLNVVKIKNRWKCSKEKLELFNVQLMTNDIDYDALRRSVYQG